jgi:hypothetical protein
MQQQGHVADALDIEQRRHPQRLAPRRTRRADHRANHHGAQQPGGGQGDRHHQPIGDLIPMQPDWPPIQRDRQC